MAKKPSLSVSKSNKKASVTRSSKPSASVKSTAKGKAASQAKKPQAVKTTPKQAAKSTGCLLPIISLFVLLIAILK